MALRNNRVHTQTRDAPKHQQEHEHNPSNPLCDRIPRARNVRAHLSVIYSACNLLCLFHQGHKRVAEVLRSLSLTTGLLQIQ